ncbi:acyltransferase [Caballeronia sp. LZ019]|uniref:acyltransferase family protein n=1 Tax=Caballeronia sp. LZ019 TaxID=3038555 RepID=UPI00285AB0FD|nr:acyltransferase [Caballeronia sp. LZ019]MDR5809532.1 acyltransferase [Caballeronia sp. LZ019]
MKNKNQSGGALPALTSIRFIAALTVVLSHFSERGLLNLPKSVFDFMDGGRSAVSMFFVLSGFILAYTYRSQIGSTGSRPFYVARFARIYPVILLGLVLCVPTVAVLLYTHDTERMADFFTLKEHVPLALALSLVAQIVLISAWFPFAAINQPWNGPSESVACEAFFYAMFPWILSKLNAVGIRAILAICAVVWLAQGVADYVLLSHVNVARSAFLVFMFPVLRIPEFILGMGAAFVFQSSREHSAPSQMKAMAMVTLALAGLAVFGVWQPATFPKYFPVFYLQAPFFALLILGLALLEGPVFGILNARWLVRLGEASYSLYLVHLPILLLAILAGFDRGNGWIAIVFTVAFSVVVFQFYEEPMRRYIRARLTGRTRNTRAFFGPRSVDMR